MSVTRWGLLGAGYISRRAIAPAMHSASGVILDVVGARDLSRAEALSPRKRAQASYEAVVADPDLDAVYIALSNDAHLPWAIAAMEQGKHVLCEKPLGCTAAETRRMYDAADATGRLLVEATWNLWHPRTARAAALLASDAIGAVTAFGGAFTFDGVNDANYRLDPARGGGALLDVGCYPLTAAAWTMWPADLAAATVTAVDVSPSTSGVDLTTDAQMSLADVPIRVRGSFIEAPFQSLTIEGERGLLEFTGNDAYTSWLQPSSLRVLDRDGERVEHFSPVDPYRLMLEQVSASIRGENAWLPDRAWSIAVADIMDAIRA
jgi:D-xylose 1-dehydrogenase (NADP+, D-xylono-1,5-lactone-forming)